MGLGNTKTAETSPCRVTPVRARRLLLWSVRCVLIAGVVGAVGAFAAIRIAMHQMGPPPLDMVHETSVTVLDRNEQLLRAYATPEGRWRLPIETGQVDQRYQRMLLAYEDGRFYSHGGVDLLAIARSAFLALRYRRIVSGASTLSMQVARLVMQKHERTAGGKFRQIVRALQIEQRLSKQEVLRLYFMLAPFGGNLEGVRAASWAYFGREPKRLSIGQAALMVALPQSPEARRPDRHRERARRARARVLDRMFKAGVVTADEVRRGNKEAIPKKRLDFPIHAPHLSDAQIAAFQSDKVHRLTVDRTLQVSLETLMRDRVKALGPRLSGAVVVVDHRTGDVRAHVGSSGFLDQSRFGSIDMAQAVRSPGSTLKPFVYGLAFESGLAHPETLIDDRPIRFGRYTPKNFDKEFRGTVTIREALQLSLNIPAVKVLSAVGPSRLLSRFRGLGTHIEMPRGAGPSLAIALGGLGLRLVDLTTIYSALARGGDAVPLNYRRHPSDDAQPVQTRRADAVQMMPPIASWYVSSILAGTPPPTNARGGRIAYKTGTSYGYRDAWAIGFDGKHTIGVWVGRPDGAATAGLTGLRAAAPILFDAFARISRQRAPLRHAPDGVVRRASGDLPRPLKRFRVAFGRELDQATQTRRIQIAYPPNKAELALTDHEGDGGRPVLLKAEGGALPLTWLVDGKPIETAPHRFETQWTPGGRGFVTISVVDAVGRTDRVNVRVR